MSSTQTPLDPQPRLDALWDRLADFPPSQITSARLHFLEEMSALLEASNAMWAGVVRLSQPGLKDPLGGWRMPVMTYLRPLPAIEETIRKYQQSYEDGPDEKIVRYHAQSGAFRVLLLRDLVAPSWFESDFYQRFFRVGMDAVDVMFVGAPVNADAEGGMAFYRNDTAFTRDDCALASHALRGLRWFQRKLLLGHGLLLADAPLTPVEQRALHLVLQGKSAKEIAVGLDQSVHTTNEYLSRLYRKYGVTSRTELMALWVGEGQR